MYGDFSTFAVIPNASVVYTSPLLYFYHPHPSTYFIRNLVNFILPLHCIYFISHWVHNFFKPLRLVGPAN